MATSSIPSQARSLLSYHDDMWHITWGETDTLAALKTEMSQPAQPTQLAHPCQQRTPLSAASCLQRTALSAASRPFESKWSGQSQSQVQQSSAASGQLQGFQAVGIMMARIPGMDCDVPAIVFSAQQEQRPQEANAAIYSSKQESASAVPCSNVDEDDVPEDPLEQGLTRETFTGELPSVGSEGHFDGSCKRCAFFSKGRCRNGKDCTHCHFAHEPRSRLRKRCALRARKGAQAESEAQESELLERAATEGSCLSEILSYLGEPEAASGIEATLCENQETCLPSTSESDSEQDQESPEVPSKDELGAARIKRFNNALEEVCKAYMTDMTDSPVEHIVKETEPAFDTVDVDTTPSVSALSDAGKVASSVTSEASDSEAPSLNESTAVSLPLGQDDASPAQARPIKTVSAKSDTLSSSPTSWRAMQASRKALSPETCTTADIERMARSLLNKLTAERFESLCSKILALPLSTPEHLAVLAAEIFEKATTQNCFRNLYTDLCMRLDVHLTAKDSVIGGKAFRKALVNECQATFERHLQPPDAALFEDLNSDECFEMQMKLKTRRLGNMRFIGDLIVRRLLAPKLLPAIVHELLSGNEDALESLIALLTVVAPEFEKQTSLYQAPIRDAFAVLRRKTSEKAVCSRMRCQISDLFDAKARSWAPRTACA